MKVIIIGSGLMGVCTAYFLNQAGADVTVVERCAGSGLETSYANGAMLHVSQAEPWNAPGIFWKVLSMLGKDDAPFVFRLNAVPSLPGWGIRFLRNSSPQRYLANIIKNAELALYNLRVMQKLKSELKLNYQQHEGGTLKIFHTQSELDESTRFFDALNRPDIAYERVDVQRISELEPALHEIQTELAGGLYYPQDESGDAHKFCHQLERICVKNGVNFMYGQEVKRFNVSAGKLAGVQTGYGGLDADAYVLAAGSDSPVILKTANTHLPVRPVKGYSITLPFSHLDTQPKLPVIDHEAHAAATPLGAHLRLVGTAEFDGYDRRIDQNRVKKLFEFARRLYPMQFANRDDKSLNQWAGLRPYTCDGVPILGKTNYDNLFLNTGHGHLGWTLAAASGQMVADVVLGKTTAIEIAPYQLNRF